jgi:periplasmic protein TonB
MAKKHPVLQRLPLVIGVVVILVGLLAFVSFVRDFAKKPEKPEREVPQVVNIVRPPPPPEQPPPPPPPPPEEKIEEPLPQDAPEPEAADDAPSLDEQLGLDAEGVAGGDGFGLAARRGGSDITGSGSGAAFAWYTGMLKDSVLDALSDDERIRKGDYRITVRIWLDPDGAIERVSLTDSTGNADLDSAIENALRRVGRVRQAPPLEMPQPVTLRIVSRG